MKHKKSTVDAKLQETMAMVHDAIADGEFSFRWLGMPKNMVSKKPYRGMNAFLLFVLTHLNPEEYQSNNWLTFNQAKEKGMKLKKGSTGAPIFYSEKREKKELNERGEKEFYWIRDYFTVFNESQFEGFTPIAEIEGTPSFDQKFDILKSLMDLTNVKLVNETDDSAFYQPSAHKINMPKLSVFLGPQEEKEKLYLCTLAHEIIHSTAKAVRPEITRSEKFTGRDEEIRYAKEEVVAELGSALLSSVIGIEKLPLSSHGGYIRGWLNLAQTDDKNWLSKASTHALNAVSYLMKLHDPENWEGVELTFIPKTQEQEAA